MHKKLRVLRQSSTGKVSRAKVREALSSVHVYPSHDSGHWEVKAIGPVGSHRRFSSKDSALSYAKSVAHKTNSKIAFHTKLTRLEVSKAGNDAVYRVVRNK